MRRQFILLMILLVVCTTTVSSTAGAEKRKNRSRTIPYRFLHPLELTVTAPRSFDIHTDMYLRSLQRNNIHPGAQFSRQSSQPALLNSPPALLNSQAALRNSQPALLNSQPALLNSQPAQLNSQPALRNSEPFFGRVVHPPKSFSSGSTFPNLPSQSGILPRSAQDGPSVRSRADTKPPHLSSAQPETTSYQILEGPYLVDAEENTSVLPLTSSIRLLKDNEKLHPRVESSVLPIKTTHHILEDKSKYTPPVYTPTFNKVADPLKTNQKLFKESDIAYFSTNTDVGVHQTQTSEAKPHSPLYFDSVQAQNAGKLNKHTSDFEGHGDFLRPQTGHESSFQRPKNPRSIFSSAKLQDSSLRFFEPHDPSVSSPTKQNTSAPLKLIDSLFTTQSPYSSLLDTNRPNGPVKLSRKPFHSFEPQHQSFNPLASSAESQKPSFLATANPYGKHMTPGKLYHSLLTTQEQIDSLLDTYSPDDNLRSFENPEGFQSQGYTPLKQVKLEHQYTSNEYYDGSRKENDVRDTNHKPNSKHRFSQPFDYTQFRDEFTGYEDDSDNEFIHNAQITQTKPDPYNQDAQQLRAFHKSTNGPYDFKVSSVAEHSRQSHKPNRYSYESNDEFLYNHDLPSFDSPETHRNFRQKPKEIKPLKPVYAPDYKKEGHLRRPEASPQKPLAGKSFKDSGRIPGIPGKDYPLLSEVPRTSFSCSKVPHRPGIYANVEAHCQAYHVCHDDRYGEQGAAFLCSNGTLFNQVTFSCDWWYRVDCKDSTEFYDLNADPRFNPYYKKSNYDARKDALEREFVPNLSRREERQREGNARYEKFAEQIASQNPSRYEETVDFSVREENLPQYTRGSEGSRSRQSGSPRLSRTRSRISHDFRRRSNEKSSSIKPPSNSTARGPTRSRSSIKS